MAWLTTPSPWGYRKLKYITNSTSSTINNYQMKFTLRWGTGTDTTSDVYLNGHANSDFSDVRITDTSGTTFLNYWLESVTSGSSAIIWVKILSIPPSGSSTYIYIYYGNSSQTTSLSNGANTFILFDDFSTNTWSGDNTYLSVSGNKVNFGSNMKGNIDVYKYKSFSFTSNVAVYHSERVNSGAYRGGVGVGFGNTPGRLNLIGSSVFARITQDIWHIAAKTGIIEIPRVTESANAGQRWYRSVYSGSGFILYVYTDSARTSLLGSATQTGIPTSLSYILITNTGDNAGDNYPGDGSFISSLFITNYTSSEPTWQIANAQETYTANLTVSSSPSGARIYLNGGDTGQTTTYIFPPLYPSNYDVLLKKAGYQDWFSGVFTLDSNQTYVVTGNLVPAQITATDVALDKTICIGPCTVTAIITWNNPGPNASFEPTIVVDGTRTGSGLTIVLATGENYQLSFNITLGVGSHTICPDPN